MIINYTKLRQLCIDNNWFTNGDNNQYSKLFEVNAKEGTLLRDLTNIIWVCSTNATWEEIDTKLREEVERQTLASFGVYR